jgi:hypothetical protein
MWQIKSRGLVSLREREGKQVRELEQFLNVEAEWVLERLSESFTSDTDRNYYQGRLDQLAQVRRFLGQPQIMRERESK